jgi:hypothetical protein
LEDPQPDIGNPFRLVQVEVLILQDHAEDCVEEAISSRHREARCSGRHWKALKPIVLMCEGKLSQDDLKRGTRP